MRVLALRAWAICFAVAVASAPALGQRIQSMAPMAGTFALHSGAALRLSATCVRPLAHTPMAQDLFRAASGIILRQADDAGHVVEHELSEAIKSGWVTVRGAGRASGVDIVPTASLPKGDWQVQVSGGAALSESDGELGKILPELARRGTEAGFRNLHSDRAQLERIVGAGDPILDVFDREAVHVGWSFLQQDALDLATTRTGFSLRRVAGAFGGAENFVRATVLMRGSALDEASLTQLAMLLKADERSITKAADPSAFQDAWHRLGALRAVTDGATARQSFADVATSVRADNVSQVVDEVVQGALRRRYGIDPEHLTTRYLEYVDPHASLGSVEGLVGRKLEQGPSMADNLVVIQSEGGLRIHYNGRVQSIEGWEQLPPAADWGFKSVLSRAPLSGKDARVLARREINAVIDPGALARLDGKRLRVIAVLPRDEAQAGLLFPDRPVADVLAATHKWEQAGIEVVSTPEDVAAVLRNSAPDEHVVVALDNGETQGIAFAVRDLGGTVLRCSNWDEADAAVRSTRSIYLDSLYDAIVATAKSNKDAATHLRDLLTEYGKAEGRRGRIRTVAVAATGLAVLGGAGARGLFVFLVAADCCDCDKCECKDCKCDRDECCKPAKAEDDAKPNP
jgi:hypothetical protein